MMRPTIKEVSNFIQKKIAVTSSYPTLMSLKLFQDGGLNKIDITKVQEKLLTALSYKTIEQLFPLSFNDPLSQSAILILNISSRSYSVSMLPIPLMIYGFNL